MEKVRYKSEGNHYVELRTISSSYKLRAPQQAIRQVKKLMAIVIMANILTNNYLFAHPADTKQH